MKQFQKTKQRVLKNPDYRNQLMCSINTPSSFSSVETKPTILSLFNKEKFKNILNAFKDPGPLIPPVNRFGNLGIYFCDQIFNILLEPTEYKINYKTHFCNGIWGTGKTKFGEILANTEYLNESATKDAVFPYLFYNAQTKYLKITSLSFAQRVESEIQNLKDSKPSKLDFICNQKDFATQYNAFWKEISTEELEEVLTPEDKKFKCGLKTIFFKLMGNILFF